MKLTDVKKTKVISFQELVETFDNLVDQINALTEAVIPVDADLDIEQQLAELTKRMEAARRGLGLVNKFPAGPQRTEHRKRIMGNLNTIRAMLGRVLKQQDQFNKAEAGYQAGVGYVQDFGRGGAEENEENVGPDPTRVLSKAEIDRAFSGFIDRLVLDHGNDRQAVVNYYLAPLYNQPLDVVLRKMPRGPKGRWAEMMQEIRAELKAISEEPGHNLGESFKEDPQGPRPKVDRNGKFVKPKRSYTKDELDDIGDREYQYRKENPKK